MKKAAVQTMSMSFRPIENNHMADNGNNVIWKANHVILFKNCIGSE